jgi:hypothetical protein
MEHKPFLRLVVAAQAACDDKDALARLEARLDPEYASFKHQLDALIR